MESATRELKAKMRRAIRNRYRSDFGKNSPLRLQQEDRLRQSLDLWGSKFLKPGCRLWAFWPSLPEEPAFAEWLIALAGSGVTVAFPRLDWDAGKLLFHEVARLPDDLVFDGQGLAQPRPDALPVGPDKVSAVLCPGLAFDRQGRRLGRGAAFYDRTLAEVPARVPRWGIGHSHQLVEEVPADPWDQSLHGLIMPEGLLPCGVKAGS